MINVGSLSFVVVLLKISFTHKPNGDITMYAQDKVGIQMMSFRIGYKKKKLNTILRVTLKSSKYYFILNILQAKYNK